MASYLILATENDETVFMPLNPNGKITCGGLVGIKNGRVADPTHPNVESFIRVDIGEYPILINEDKISHMPDLTVILNGDDLAVSIANQGSCIDVMIDDSLKRLIEKLLKYHMQRKRS